MTIRITYVKDGRVKRVTVEGSTTADAVAWMGQNAPGVYVFRASVMRRPYRGPSRAMRRLAAAQMVAMDETGTGAFRAPRRPR